MSYDLGCFDEVTVNVSVSVVLSFVDSLIITLQLLCYTGFVFPFKWYNSNPYSIVHHMLRKALLNKISQHRRSDAILIKKLEIVTQ
jgi:hypothetical protein